MRLHRGYQCGSEDPCQEPDDDECEDQDGESCLVFSDELEANQE